MQKLKRVLALCGVVILVGMYALTLIFALSSSPNAANMLIASIVYTVIIPCLLYGMILIARVLGSRNLPAGDDETKDSVSDSKHPKNAKG